MGNYSCCLNVLYSSEYQPLVEDDDDDDNLGRSCSSVTNASYHCEMNNLIRSTNHDMIFPQQFGKFYALGDLVGVGTTSKVYKVSCKINTKWSSSESQKLACKIIDKRGITHGVDEYDIDPLLEQLCREVEILKRIHHENIVSFYDYMETKDHLFIITERLEGGELFDHILNNGPVAENIACRILYGVFSAVAYLHERGVIHRDIKAENLIFFKNSYGEDSLKLIDFGFSTILRHHLTGSFMGTGGYIAPEIRQSKNYSTSVDAWSLGILLYCMMSAKLPFGISTTFLPSSMEKCQGLFVLVFPPHLWAHISGPCKDLISKLLELDPIKRYTAKNALAHPWFAKERQRQKQLGLPTGMLSSNSMDTVADLNLAGGCNDNSLPVLHPHLRPTMSMSELECLRSRNGGHQLTHSTKHSHDHLAYSLVEYDMVVGKTFSLGTPDSPASSPASPSAVKRKERAHKLYGPDSPTSTDKASHDTKHSDRSSDTTSHERTLSGTSWIPPSAPENRPGRASTDDWLTGVAGGTGLTGVEGVVVKGGQGGMGHRSALLWGETHSHLAGELFYTTFQHAAAIASPKRSPHS